MTLHNAALTDTEFGWRLKEENQPISNLMLNPKLFCTYPQMQHYEETNREVWLTFLKQTLDSDSVPQIK